MNQSEADQAARELFDPDLPNVVSATFGGYPEFYGSLSREEVVTDGIVGIRSVFLCASADVRELQQNATIDIDGETMRARVIDSRGRALTGIILGK